MSIKQFSLVLLCAFVGLPTVLSAQDSDPAALTSQGDVDWNEGRFFLTLRCSIPTGDESVAPKRRYRAELYLQNHLKEQFVEQAGKIRMESGMTLRQAADKDPEVLSGLDDLGDHLKFHYSKVNPEYTQLEMKYSAGLWDDFAAVFPEIVQTNPLARQVVWSPTRPFSGLVIFAMGPLPWMGTGTSASWVPALTYRLLDPRGEVVFDRSKMDPDLLKKWGMGVYSKGKFNEEKWRDRIGNDPLRIVARGVWGTVPTDLIVADDDWNRILAQDENRRFLAEGRVLILWGDFPVFPGTPYFNSIPQENEPPTEVVPQPPPPPAAPKPKGE